jgi:hypothetical protein
MFPSGLKLRLSGEPGIPSKNISVVPEKKKNKGTLLSLNAQLILNLIYLL